MVLHPLLTIGGGHYGPISISISNLQAKRLIGEGSDTAATGSGGVPWAHKKSAGRLTPIRRHGSGRHSGTLLARMPDSLQPPRTAGLTVPTLRAMSGGSAHDL